MLWVDLVSRCLLIATQDRNALVVMLYYAGRRAGPILRTEGSEALMIRKEANGIPVCDLTALRYVMPHLRRRAVDHILYVGGGNNSQHAYSDNGVRISLSGE